MIKELNPLEALSYLVESLKHCKLISTAENELIKIIETALKALKIIKEKGIILQFIKETYTVEQYNAGVFGTLVKPLTQEEYELLKEIDKGEQEL